MEMSNLRVESHIAQKSRRDKLRIQQNADPNQHLEEYNNNMEQFSVHHQVLGQAKYGSLSYDPNVFSSEMLSYVARNPQLLLPQNDALVAGEESGSAQFDRANGVSFAHLSHQIPSKVNVDPQNSTTWKSIGSQQSCDWVGNYSNGLAGVEQSNPNNFSSSSLYGKSSSFGYHQDLDSVSIAAGEISGHHRLHAQKHYGEIHYGSSPICQNNLQEVVPSVSESQRFEMASLAQPHMREDGNNSNELLLLPAYGDQSKTLQLNNDSRWINRSIGGCHPWNADSDFLANKSNRNPTIVANDNCSTQGLSLSLSSVPQIESHTGRFGGRDDSQDLLSRAGALINDLPGSKASKFDLLCNSHSKGFIGTKIVESTHQNTVGPSGLPRSTGPLGPFTGYATILKSSKYLKPTQQLLSESCYVSGQERVQPCEVYSRKNSEGIGITVESMVRAKDGDSGASSSAIYGSNENISGEAGAGGRSSSSESHRPEIRQKKVKLIYMQEEICRRYKQYHQQMQMVVSSFESVAGLSSATPYISLALKAVTRHFRSLKNAITVQLRHTRKALGEDLSSPTTGTSSSRGDNAGTSRTRIFDHGFQKHYKSGGCFLEPQQPVWRPQRGLPERAVSVLRAWLFDHFLHPYPTDTDKHMLATQTGLTRNQVSNWFINARVRVWKPMVEEIHTLETKALEETNSNADKVVRRPPTEGAIRLDNDELPTGRLLSTNPTSNMQAECSRNNTVTLARMGGDEANPEFWNQEKRSRVECQIPASMDGSLLGFEPYQQGGIDIGRLGAVSLTLGLRQGAENAQQQQLQQHQEHQLRQQFGGHIIHDFVG